MSRIDEAMRRAGVPLSDATVTGIANPDAFVSPWEIGRDLPHSDASGAPSAVRLDHGGNGSSLHQPASPPPLISRLVPGWSERLALSNDADPVLMHQFRRLAATLVQAQRSGQLKTVMISSASPGDGKTLTALNLALVLSESYGRRVLLVEADLRRPAICATLGLPTTSRGLNDVIKSSDEQKASLIKLTESLTLMPAGRPNPDPLSGLTSSRLGQQLQEASEGFDWVIVDTPPLGATPDASLMTPLVDAILLVIRAGQTPCADVQHAIETIGPERILGVVLNGISPDAASGSGSYYGYYPSTK